MENRFVKRTMLNQEILGKITQIDEFKGLWKGSLRLSPQTLGRLKRSVLITSTGASTRIEGSKMSDEEVARLIQGLKSTPPRGRDAEEVAGYADLLGRIFDNWKTLKITEGQILHFHKILLNFSEKDKRHRGNYKTEDNKVVMRKEDGTEVVIFEPTKPYLTKKEMDDVLSWLKERQEKKDIHPLVIIANFVFEFLAIHPFQDGNGRLSRAVTNLMMLQSGYAYTPYVSLEEIIEERKADYYLSLRKTQKNHKTENENIEPWLTFFLDCILVQVKKALDLLNGNSSENLLSEIQRKIYDLFEQDIEFSVSEIQNKIDVPLPTVKKSVARLFEYKLIEKLGQGPATRYKKLK